MLYVSCASAVPGKCPEFAQKLPRKCPEFARNPDTITLYNFTANLQGTSKVGLTGHHNHTYASAFVPKVN